MDELQSTWCTSFYLCDPFKKENEQTENKMANCLYSIKLMDGIFLREVFACFQQFIGVGISNKQVTEITEWLHIQMNWIHSLMLIILLKWTVETCMR